MPDLYELRDEPPLLNDPLLVMGLEGWIDAGFGGAAAMGALLGSIETQLLAVFDADSLLDHRARRPVLRIVDGVNSSLAWPEIQVRYGRDPGGNEVLFLVGPEPDHYWRAFTGAVIELSRQLGVRMAVGLGAFPAPVPHTRPTRLAATSTSPELAKKVGFVAGTIEVPAGVHAALERAFADGGIPAVGLWARVPHYAAASPYPAASAALLDGLAEIGGLVIDSSELKSAAGVALERLDELIAQSDEHEALVRQLEMQLDEAETPFDLRNLPSGDELAAELERFLRGET